MVGSILESIFPARLGAGQAPPGGSQTAVRDYWLDAALAGLQGTDGVAHGCRRDLSWLGPCTSAPERVGVSDGLVDDADLR